MNDKIKVYSAPTINEYNERELPSTYSKYRGRFRNVTKLYKKANTQNGTMIGEEIQVDGEVWLPANANVDGNVVAGNFISYLETNYEIISVDAPKTGAAVHHIKLLVKKFHE